MRIVIEYTISTPVQNTSFDSDLPLPSAVRRRRTDADGRTSDRDRHKAFALHCYAYLNAVSGGTGGRREHLRTKHQVRPAGRLMSAAAQSSRPSFLLPPPPSPESPPAFLP